MRQQKQYWISVLSLMLFGACMGPRLGTPTQVTQDVVGATDEGRTEDAIDILEAVVRRPDLRDLVFPQLYAVARERYEEGNPREAAGILRALSAGYKGANSALLGFAYSLFLVRAETASPSPGEIDELRAVLDEIESRSSSTAPWVRLARAQNSIDRGELDAAREALADFHKRWDGQPDSLAPYIDDLGRYLSSH